MCQGISLKISNVSQQCRVLGLWSKYDNIVNIMIHLPVHQSLTDLIKLVRGGGLQKKCQASFGKFYNIHKKKLNQNRDRFENVYSNLFSPKK